MPDSGLLLSINLNCYLTKSRSKAIKTKRKESMFSANNIFKNAQQAIILTSANVVSVKFEAVRTRQELDR